MVLGMQPIEDPLADEALRSIRRILRAVSVHSKELARVTGMTLPQIMCLRAVRALEEKGTDVSVATVAERVELSRPTASRVVDRLVDRGLVNRTRDPADRRRVRLTLTAVGLERLQMLPVPLQDRFLHRFAAMDEADRRALIASLRRVAAMMNAKDLDAAPILAPGPDLHDEE